MNSAVAVLVRAARTYVHAALGLALALPALDVDIATLKVLAAAALPAAVSVIQNSLEAAGVGIGPRG